MQCIVEITTDVCNHPKELIDDIAPKINQAINYSEKNNIQLLSMPIHPFSRVSEQSVTENKRYLDFLINILAS